MLVVAVIPPRHFELGLHAATFDAVTVTLVDPVTAKFVRTTLLPDSDTPAKLTAPDMLDLTHICVKTTHVPASHPIATFPLAAVVDTHCSDWLRLCPIPPRGLKLYAATLLPIREMLTDPVVGPLSRATLLNARDTPPKLNDPDMLLTRFICTEVIPAHNPLSTPTELLAITDVEENHFRDSAALQPNRGPKLAPNQAVPDTVTDTLPVFGEFVLPRLLAPAVL